MSDAMPDNKRKMLVLVEGERRDTELMTRLLNMYLLDATYVPALFSYPNTILIC